MEALAPDRISRLLAALGERLALAGERVDLVVIGGFALTLLGLVDRATRDVDVVALMADGSLRPAQPLPPALVEARAAVAADSSRMGGSTPGPPIC